MKDKLSSEYNEKVIITDPSITSTKGMIVSYTAVFVPSPKLTLLRDKEGFVGDEEDHEDGRDFHLSFLEKKNRE